MSSLVVLAASVFEISCGKNRQTNRQKKTGNNPNPSTAVGVGN